MIESRVRAAPRLFVEVFLAEPSIAAQHGGSNAHAQHGLAFLALRGT